jgi:H+/Cl- antiporter ClcA
MARSVQRPDSPGYSAIVFRGGQGTGKSFVAKTLGSLFGRHFMQVTDPKHLVGSFNATCGTACCSSATRRSTLATRSTSPS